MSPSPSNPTFIFGLKFSANGRRLLMVCESALRVWDVPAGREVRPPAAAAIAAVMAAISADGLLLAATGEANASLSVWNLETGLQRKMATDASRDADLVFSPNGKLLGGSASDGSIVIWDVESGRVLRNLTGHSGKVRAIAFSADGRLLASGGADKTTKIWDVATGEEQLSLSGYTDMVAKIAFSPDGKRLTTVTQSGAALVYAVDPQDLLAAAEKRITRALTPDECRKFLHTDICLAGPAGSTSSGR